MISWVRDRVSAARWIQTRKRDESAGTTTTGQTEDDDDDDEEEDEAQCFVDDNDDDGDDEFVVAQEDNNGDSSSATTASIRDDLHPSHHHQQRTVKASGTPSPQYSPRRTPQQQRHRRTSSTSSSSPIDHHHHSKSPTRTATPKANRSIRLEKQISKLEMMGNLSEKIMRRISRDRRPAPPPSPPTSLFSGCSPGGATTAATGRSESFIRRKLSSTFRRKKSSVAPTTTSSGLAGGAEAVPIATTSSSTSPAADARTTRVNQQPQSTDSSSSPSANNNNNQRPSSFSFLNRRFFSGSRNRSTTNATQTCTATGHQGSNCHHHSHSRQQQQRIGGGGATKRDNNNGPSSSSVISMSMSTVSASGGGERPPVVPTANTPLGIFPPHPTTTGTISKLSSSSSPNNNNNSSGRGNITIRIISIKGGFIDVNFPITKTAKELKLEAIGRFAVDTDALPLYAMNLENILGKYKLVTINRRHVIDEELTLDRLGLKNKDQLLLVVKRGGAASAVDKRREALEEEVLLRGPSPKEIEKATQHLPPTEATPPKVNIDDMVLQTDLQYDIRKILISLAQSSAYVIGAGPYADRLILMLKQRLINKRKSETDSLNCLLDMGFQQHRALYALQLKQHVYADALRWLIENPRLVVPTAEQMETAELFEEVPLGTAAEDAGHGDDCSGEGGDEVGDEHVAKKPRRQSTDEVEAEVEEAEDAEEEVARKQEIKVLDAGLNSFNSRKDYIETLLEVIRIHSQRDLPLCDETVAKLMEMGFQEEEVREALKITQNNQAAACEWLIGSRSKSLTELRDGLPADSPILKALLASPQVQISLGNPKMLLAYLSMLENYSSMNQWLSDTDTSGVLGHILRTYHEEKHIVAINQFSIVL